MSKAKNPMSNHKESDVKAKRIWYKTKESDVKTQRICRVTGAGRFPAGSLFYDTAVYCLVCRKADTGRRRGAGAGRLPLPCHKNISALMIISAHITISLFKNISVLNYFSSFDYFW